MRILHAQQYPFHPELIPGGPFSAGYHISHELAARPGIEVQVVTLTKEIDKNLQRIDGNVPVTFLAQKQRRIVPNQITDVSRIVRAIEDIRPDIASGQLAIYGVAAGKTAVPSVYLIHGVISREAQIQKSLKARLVYQLYARMDRRAAGMAKHIIATSPYVIGEYRNITKARFHVIDNAVDDRYFEVQSREGPPRLFLGGLVYERKNILGALEIVRQLKWKYSEILLVVAGRIADPGYYSRCLAFIERHQLEKNVTFLGQASTDQVLEELAACSMLILTSSQETAPLIISEAMAAGRPIISADVGGCAFMVEDGESGFIVPWQDTGAFVERIAALLDDQGLSRRFGARAREIAEQRFRRSIVADQTLAVYEEVLGSK